MSTVSASLSTHQQLLSSCTMLHQPQNFLLCVTHVFLSHDRELTYGVSLYNLTIKNLKGRSDKQSHYIK